MDKEKVYNDLRASRDINTFRKSPRWQAAFDLYNKQHGTKLKPSCGKCFATVKKWLEA